VLKQNFTFRWTRSDNVLKVETRWIGRFDGYCADSSAKQTCHNRNWLTAEFDVLTRRKFNITPTDYGFDIRTSGEGADLNEHHLRSTTMKRSVQRQRVNQGYVAEDVWIGSHFDVAMDQAGSWTGSTKSQGLYISCDGRRTGIVDPVSRLESPAHLSWKVGTIRWTELQRSERTIFKEPASREHVNRVTRSSRSKTMSSGPWQRTQRYGKEVLWRESSVGNCQPPLLWY